MYQAPNIYNLDGDEKAPSRLRELRVISRLINAVFAIAILGTATYAADAARDFLEIRADLNHHMATVVRKGELLGQLRSAVGYGGFIHNFKNYVLRQEDYRPAQLVEDMRRFRALIEEYRRVEISREETAALDAIAATFDTYEAMIAIAARYAAEGRTPAETDARVKVDDRAAVKGFEVLNAAWEAGYERYSRGLAAGVARSLDKFQIALVALPLFLLVGIGLIWFQRRLVGEIRAFSAVSDRLDAADALNRAVMDSVNYAIIGADAEGRITVFNRAAELLTGYAPEAVMGKPGPLLFLDPDELAEAAEQLAAETGEPVAPGIGHFRAAVARTGTYAREWSFRRADGGRVPVLLSVSMLKSGSEPVGFVGIAYDIAERKKLENMQREFLSTVSHELRTPLTSIAGSLALIQGGAAGQLPAKARQLVDIAQQNGQRLQLLVNDLLDVERLQSDRMSFDFREHRLAGLIADAVAANEAYATARGVRIEIAAMPPDQVRVRADGDRVGQVLANLLSNAAKYSPDGGAVEIRARAAGACAEVAVSDHGPGIPARHRDRVFDRFWQVDSSDSRAKQGTGLGLAIAKGIVAHHGGEIRVVETPGGGATFAFTLPLAETADQAAD